MPLTTGARLGPYEVVAPLGAGGMGEVYRARDPKLHRSVAIKVLPDFFASDPDRLARFEREARVLASLNHPHIAHIYGLEAQHDRSFIVMELVEGETLAQWMARQPPSAPPIDEVIAIARQMAAALEVAHEQGIVHRDFKPANVKVAPDGTVKVLDFGLARAAPDELQSTAHGTNSPTMTTPADMTRAGLVLGTAAYMSPEQAKGRVVDKRADIWAFGCVLFEMLTRRPAFSRDTLTETLAAVMRDNPPLNELPRTTPPYLRTLVARCLERDPRRRLRDIGEARVILEQPPHDREQPAAPEPMPGRGWRVALPWVIATAAVAALALMTTRVGVNGPPSLSKIVVPMPQPFVDITRPVIALSPDGQQLAFVGQQGQSSLVYLRDVDGFDATPLTGTDGARSIFFSPDGEWIGFYTPGRIKKVSTRGGSPVTLATVTDYLGATWMRSGTIIVANGSATLLAVPANGGESHAIPPVAGTAQDKALPHALADGQTVLYTAGASGRPSSVVARRLDSDTEKVLVTDATDPTYLDEHLIFARLGTLFAVRFDANRLEVQGTPVPVLQGVQFNRAFETTQYAVSATGRLAYMPAASTSQARQLAMIDRAGAVSVVSDLRGGLYMPRVAPDARRVAITVRNEDAYSISIVDVVTGTTLELVAEGMAPVWSPDGRHIAFAVARRDGGLSLRIVPTDRSGPPVPVLDDRTYNVPTSWSRDGQLIALTRVQEGGPTGEDIYLIAPDGSGLRPALRVPGNQHAGTFSPDGRWLAYVLAETSSIFVSQVGNFGRQWRADIDGGSSPAWSPDGRELLFLGGPQRDQLVTVAVKVHADGLELAKPTPVAPVSMGTSIGFGLRRYDVMPDGQRFVFATADAPAPPEIRLLLDFRSQLASLVGR